MILSTHKMENMHIILYVFSSNMQFAIYTILRNLLIEDFTI